jgi:xylan 1,4-beta-xylosidase
MCKRLHYFRRTHTVLLGVLRRDEQPSSAPRHGRNWDSKWRRTLRVARVLTFILLVSSRWLTAQEAPASVNIQVKADQEEGPWKPIWNYFGYDEPNYAYSPNGKKLLGELAALSPVPVYVRTHNLFTSGDGSASLKWGSTNVYTEDASGKPIYDWTIVDRIFDTYHELGMKPLVELGFMPQALSVKPEPYRHSFPEGSIYTGWAYPPNNDQKWADLVFHFVKHLRERYGDAETRSWLWEVWNEPDIGYWKGTREQYFKLYDYAVDAVLRALPGAQVGGPDTTGPLGDSAAEYLRLFLEHCAHQRNYATGKTGAPLDFVSFHAKGAPTLANGHVRMGIRHQLAAIQRGFKIVTSFPEWQNKPIILGESDPEGCAACSAQKHPENAYRNGPLFASYTVAVLNQIDALAAREQVNFQGALTWSFEFEGQPYFAGFRELATNGIDKPVLNAFRMLGLLGGRRLAVSSTGAVPADEVLKTGVRSRPDVNAIATRQDQEITILAWNYQDDDVPAPDAPVDLAVTGIPPTVKQVLIEHFRVDGSHSNAYAEWQRRGSPMHPSADEYRQLENLGQLQQMASPQWRRPREGQIKLEFTLPRQGLSLLRITW